MHKVIKNDRPELIAEHILRNVDAGHSPYIELDDLTFATVVSRMRKYPYYYDLTISNKTTDSFVDYEVAPMKHRAWKMFCGFLYWNMDSVFMLPLFIYLLYSLF